MAIERGSIGGIGLEAGEFKQMVLEVAEDAVLARQAAYDTVMEVLSQTVTGEKAIQFLTRLDEQSFAQIATRDPDQARQILETLREREEAGR